VLHHQRFLFDDEVKDSCYHSHEEDGEHPAEDLLHSPFRPRDVDVLPNDLFWLWGFPKEDV
jgi:hypothetical protein